jgi:hypothetical protein
MLGRVIVLDISNAPVKSGSSNQTEQSGNVPEEFVLEQNFPIRLIHQ